MRFNRLDNKHFAELAENNGIFGSAQLSDNNQGVTTSDYNQIPSLQAFKEGWNSATLTSKRLPPLEEFQGLESYLSYLINYLYQEGTALWNSNQAYFKGSFCKTLDNDKPILWYSKTDNNVNNEPAVPSDYWQIVDFSLFANTDLSNLSATGNNKFMTSDTAQTITGAKTFGGMINIDNNFTGSGYSSAIKFSSNGTTSGYLYYYAPDDNFAFTDASYTLLMLRVKAPMATDNSSKVATTAWVRNHCCTTAATTTSTASKDAPAYVVENYKSGDAWYRKWSDGWIEQGGKFYNSTSAFQVVSLHKAFTTADYNIQLTGYYTAAASATPVVYNGTDVTYTKKTTMFSGFFGAYLYCDWYACGY